MTVISKKMDIGEYFRFEIVKLLKTIDYNCDFSLTISCTCNFDRCIARVWDSANWDINKRCVRAAIKNDLCAIHHKKSPSGYITQYPDEKKVLKAYRKHNKNVDKDIDLSSNTQSKIIFKSSNLKFNINLKTKNKINNNLRMSFESIDDLTDIISAHDTDNLTELRKRVLLDLKTKHNFYVTVAEDRILKKLIEDHIRIKYSQEDTINDTNDDLLDEKPTISDIDDIKTMDSQSSSNDILDNDILDNHIPDNYTEDNNNAMKHVEFDLNTMEQVKVIDVEFNESVLYIHYDDNDNLLYNDKKNLIGFYRHWIDDDDEVPVECKTKDGKVLNPHTKLPIIEIEITPHGSMYTGLVHGIYREYEYNEEFESFRNTNQIYK